jgi:hypothetical protein
MRRLLPVVLSGCVYVVRSPGPDHAPRVLDAEAYVYYDDYYRDDIWDLQALVGDPDGVLDVNTVWADVYDEGAGGDYVQSFQLYPTQDASYWWSDWLASTTFVDPFYGGYSMEIVAYDRAGKSSSISIIPDAYAPPLTTGPTTLPTGTPTGTTQPTETTQPTGTTPPGTGDTGDTADTGTGAP